MAIHYQDFSWSGDKKLDRFSRVSAGPELQQL